MELEMISKYGFPIVYSVAVSGFLAWLIKYVIKEAAKEKKILQEIITNHVAHNTEAMNKLMERIEEFRKNVEIAHTYQRDEHMKMIEKLK